MVSIGEAKKRCSLARCRMQVQYYLHQLLFKTCQIKTLSLETALLSSSCYRRVVKTSAPRHLNVSLMQEQQQAAFTADFVSHEAGLDAVNSMLAV